MPKLEISDRELVVHLDKWEQFFSLVHEVKVPLTQIVSIKENKGLKTLRLGWRLPGTHIPFVIAAGAFIYNGARQFVYRRRGMETVVIDLKGNQWTRLIIGIHDVTNEVSRLRAAVRGGLEMNAENGAGTNR